jgi:hypothetical protein
MCVVSNIIDTGMKTWPNPTNPEFVPWAPPVIPNTLPDIMGIPFEALRNWKELLEKAKKFDELTNQPNCESPEKVEYVNKLTDRLIEIGTELIKDTSKTGLGVELIQLAKDIKDTLGI